MAGHRRDTLARRQPKSALDALDLHARIDAAIIEHGSRPHWTPVEGALLLCGVLPPPVCSEIPDDALRLASTTGTDERATLGQLARARKVLDEWDEDKRFETGSPADLEEKVSPLEFILWAEDVFGKWEASKKPQWFDYFLFRTVEPAAGQLPPPIPAELVLRGIDLEIRVTSKPKGTKNTSSSAGKPSDVTPQLRRAAQALVDAGIRPDLEAVRTKVREMTRRRDCGAIVQVDTNGTLIVSRPDNTERPYKEAALVRWVNRNLEKLDLAANLLDQ